MQSIARQALAVSLLATIFGCWSGSAGAAIIDGYVTGGTNPLSTFQKLDNFSGAVGFNNFDTPILYGFDELQDVQLVNDLQLDVGGTVAAGTVVESHYVFFDPRRVNRVIGQVFFDSEILGLITTTGRLQATDTLFGLDSVDYLTHILRGLESVEDTATVFDPWTLSVSLQASSPGDYVRVITQKSTKGLTPSGSLVPEPSVMALLLSGLLALAYYRPLPAQATRRF